LTFGQSPLRVTVVGKYVEQFQLPLSVSESEEACHLALRWSDWEEQASDRVEYRVPFVGDDELYVSALLRIPVVRRYVKRLTTPSAQAPEGPPRVDAEIRAVRGRNTVARISLQERGAFGTNVTISGATLGGGETNRRVRGAILELRRSIEVQSGSLTPQSLTQGS
jgi:hypothetical protein